MRTIGLLLCLPALAVGVARGQDRAKDAKTLFRTEAVRRGDLTATVRATGTVQPEEIVDVGAQVAGQIIKFGADPRDRRKTIDFGCPVEAGTILAQIDPAPYEAREKQAQAKVLQTQASLKLTQARLIQADRNWQRAQRLFANRAISTEEFDALRANFDVAKAEVNVAEANVEVARAALREAQVNLAYTTIRSPIKGVVIDRRVNVGQTVVANLNAPSLFLIGKDLKRLQVWATVPEAAIGGIRSGQKAVFTVDAYPRQTFAGVVAPDQPRLNAGSDRGKVAYTVVVQVDNAPGLLIPYMTARVRFVAGERKNVLLVPDAALRWQPSLGQVAPAAREEYARWLKAKQQEGLGDAATEARARVWVAEKGYVRPVAVRLGLRGGSRTEVVGGALEEGTRVVIGVRGETSGKKD